MSTTGQNNQQLKKEIQHELITANQLLQLISTELQLIKNFTNRGGDFENTIKQNAALMQTLANILQIDIENLPPITRKQLNYGDNDSPAKEVANGDKSEMELTQ